jgi:hypothetical protein
VPWVLHWFDWEPAVDSKYFGVRVVTQLMIGCGDMCEPYYSLWWYRCWCEAELAEARLCAVSCCTAES